MPHCSLRQRRDGNPLRRGLTLIEILISTALTLLIILALVQAFDFIGGTVNQSRAAIDLAGQVRNAQSQLQQDLDRVSSRVAPWIEPNAAEGYFEYYEGPIGAGSPAFPTSDQEGLQLSPGGTNDSPIGDLDDVLIYTIQSRGAPFRGRGPTGTVESTLAEVVWWVARIDLNGNGVIDTPVNGIDIDPPVLLRRILVVRPERPTVPPIRYPAIDPPVASNPPNPRRFFRDYDISARLEYDPAAGQWFAVPNSMSDVADRSRRFAHRVQAAVASQPPQPVVLSFPHELVFSLVTALADPYDQSISINLRSGSYLPRLLSPADVSTWAANWVVMSDLLAFDARVFDATAALVNSGSGFVLSPGDLNWALPTTSSPLAIAGRGAMVDLGYAAGLSATQRSTFSWIPFREASNPVHVSLALLGRTYDTWSLGYERDGLDQFNNGSIDTGTDGIDNNRNGVVDEPEERETSPPYNTPLRGIQVRIRALDVGSRQVRQVSVMGDFTRGS